MNASSSVAALEGRQQRVLQLQHSSKEHVAVDVLVAQKPSAGSADPKDERQLQVLTEDEDDDTKFSPCGISPLASETESGSQSVANGRKRRLGACGRLQLHSIWLKIALTIVAIVTITSGIPSLTFWLVLRHQSIAAVHTQLEVVVLNRQLSLVSLINSTETTVTFLTQRRLLLPLLYDHFIAQTIDEDYLRDQTPRVLASSAVKLEAVVSLNGTVIMSNDEVRLAIGQKVDLLEFQQGRVQNSMGLPYRTLQNSWEVRVGGPICIPLDRASLDSSASAQTKLVAVGIVSAPAATMYDVLHNRTGLQESGQVVLAARNGDYIDFIMPPNNADSLRLSFYGQGRPMQLALLGQAGSVIAPNYANVTVVAHYRPLGYPLSTSVLQAAADAAKGSCLVDNTFPAIVGNTSWGIVSMMDKSVAYEQVNRLRTIMVVVYLSVVTVGVVAALWLAHHITRPITALAAAATAIGEGNLSARAESVARRTKQLAHAKILAEQASEAKSAFLANVSHEIRTPLNGVLGMTELTLETELNPEQRELLALVKSSALHLLHLLKDILDFSYMEAHSKQKQQPHSSLSPLPKPCVEFVVADRLEHAAQMLGVRAQAKGLELICRVHPNVPVRLRGDPDRLVQVAVNLLSNSVKFTDEGEITMDVSVVEDSSEHKKDFSKVELCICVRDTGMGVPDDKKHRLFQPFSQVDQSSTRKYGGSGLGLAISSRIAADMSGRMWMEDVQPHGAAFYCTAVLDVAPALGEDALPSFGGFPVLVVDDNTSARSVLAEMLSSWGSSVTTAASADEALSLASPHLFKLAFVDASMPNTDGFTFTEALRQKCPDLLVVLMLSSTDLMLDAARCRQLQVLGFFLKPMRRSLVLRLVRKALQPKSLLPAAPAESSLQQPAESLERKAEDEQAEHQHRTRQSNKGALNVLLVEDNKVNQMLAVRLLQRAGHRSTVAMHGREAVELWTTGSYDVILMDIQMPIMDGLEATMRIRELETELSKPSTPIIAMTAHAMPGDKERCLSAGMDGYLTKPISANELVLLLSTLVVPTPRANDEDSSMNAAQCSPTQLSNGSTPPNGHNAPSIASPAQSNGHA
eukprot:jgi/Chlat1/898/Chrsp107S01335